MIWTEWMNFGLDGCQEDWMRHLSDLCDVRLRVGEQGRDTWIGDGLGSEVYDSMPVVQPVVAGQIMHAILG